MTKFTFDEAMQALADQQNVESHEVKASALKRKVWIARWQMPGCMPDWIEYLDTKADAVQTCLDHHSYCESAPRGMKTSLQKSQSYQQTDNCYYYMIEHDTLGGLL